jgi:hypothetical protein
VGILSFDDELLVLLVVLPPVLEAGQGERPHAFALVHRSRAQWANPEINWKWLPL